MHGGAAMPVKQIDLTRVLLLSALLWQGSAGCGHAQSRSHDHTAPLVDDTEAADEISAGVAVDESFGIYALPIPIVDPTIGNGLGVGVLTTFRLDEDDRVSPRSTVALGAGYAPTAARNSAATRSCCASVMPGYSGNVRISPARRSATGWEPGPWPRNEKAGWRCTGTG